MQLFSDRKKIIGLAAFFLLFLAVPLTVFIAQQRQEIRQRASENLRCELRNGDYVNEGFTCSNGKPEYCTCFSDGCSFHDTDVNSCNRSCGNPGQAYCNNQGQGGDPTEAGNGNGCIEKVPGEGIARRNSFGVCRGADTPSCAQTNTNRPTSCTCNQDSQCASGKCTNYNCEAPQTPTNTPTPTRTPTPTLLPGQPTATSAPGSPTATPTPSAAGSNVVGDVDVDGDVDLNDWNIVARNCYGSNVLTPSCGTNAANADINKDGKVNFVDLNFIQRNFSL